MTFVIAGISMTRVLGIDVLINNPDNFLQIWMKAYILMVSYLPNPIAHYSSGSTGGRLANYCSMEIIEMLKGVNPSPRTLIKFC